MAEELTLAPDEAKTRYFDEFWRLWPSPADNDYSAYTRKVNKKRCEQLWRKGRLDSVSNVILRDVENRKKHDLNWRQQKGAFLVMPEVYIRNERWNDGEFADVRNKGKPGPWKEPQKQQQTDGGPQLSRYAVAANRVLLILAYQDVRRGLVPIGKENLARVLATKNEIVAAAETAGDWIDADFNDVIQSALEKALGTSKQLSESR